MIGSWTRYTCWKRVEKSEILEGALRGLVSQEVQRDENLVDDDIKFRMCSTVEKEMAMTTLIEGAHGM
jgi:hypothetical protein